MMTVRRRTVEHVFRNAKALDGSTHFLAHGLEHGSTEMSVQVPALQTRSTWHYSPDCIMMGSWRAYRVARTAAASFFPSVFSAAMAGRCLARGRALPPSQG